MNTAFNKQRGFTLVEIAIVLVIIGLLLGGILKGQELITSARVRNIADQNSGVQAAYYGFIDRYRQVPGDMTGSGANSVCNVVSANAAGCSGGTTTIAGDANGQLKPNDWGEGSALWAHLSAANFIQGAYVGGATDATSYSQDNVAPKNAFNGYIMLTQSADYVGGTPTTRLLMVVGHLIPANVMSELDRKIDDGLPLTGVLRATPNSGNALGSVSTISANCTTTSGTTTIWDINTNDQDCGGAYLY
ncbi:MAG TPA: prepilin-type N-terminal cleavage/methylation domain-containing protein [Gammaproteobacteria bacterium]|nr:prepilin-type N-terminal cleavage/methylation domain-containing protein [Gammaproteobacteria bacterium]